MRIIFNFERYTENFSVYTFDKGDKTHVLYLPKLVTTRKQPFEIIVSTRPNNNLSVVKEVEALRSENAELKRRLNAIRNLA